MKWIKITTTILLSLVVILTIFYVSFTPTKNPSFGITYSPTYAAYLGLDPIKGYEEILSTLHPKHVRLTAYFETVEPAEGKFDFSQIDALLTLSEKYNTDVLLVLGHKQPRWPECHHPDWYPALPATEQRQAILDLITAQVNHFKSFPVISRWQVENEALFDFGLNCKPLTKKELAEEIKLVKQLDTRPVVLTDSGEKGGWFTAAKLSDVFGPTMYRTVYNPKYGGYMSYRLPPAFYRVRAGMLVLFTKTNKFIGAELQGEPWFAHDIHETPVADQLALMSAKQLQENAEYARKVGFAENYFFGAEWWLWLKHSKNDNSLVEAAYKILNP